MANASAALLPPCQGPKSLTDSACRKRKDTLGWYAKDNEEPSIMTDKLRKVIADIHEGPLRSFLNNDILAMLTGKPIYFSVQ